MNHISPVTGLCPCSPFLVLFLLLALPGGPEPQFSHLRLQLGQLAVQRRLPGLGRQELLHKAGGLLGVQSVLQTNIYNVS